MFLRRHALQDLFWHGFSLKWQCCLPVILLPTIPQHHCKTSQPPHLLPKPSVSGPPVCTWPPQVCHSLLWNLDLGQRDLMFRQEPRRDNIFEDRDDLSWSVLQTWQQLEKTEDTRKSNWIRDRVGVMVPESRVCLCYSCPRSMLENPKSSGINSTILINRIVAIPSLKQPQFRGTYLLHIISKWNTQNWTYAFNPWPMGDTACWHENDIGFLLFLYIGCVTAYCTSVNN